MTFGPYTTGLEWLICAACVHPPFINCLCPTTLGGRVLATHSSVAELALLLGLSTSAGPTCLRDDWLLAFISLVASLYPTGGALYPPGGVHPAGVMYPPEDAYPAGAVFAGQGEGLTPMQAFGCGPVYRGSGLGSARGSDRGSNLGSNRGLLGGTRVGAGSLVSSAPSSGVALRPWKRTVG